MSGNQAAVRVRVGLREAQSGRPALPQADTEISRIVRLLALAHRWHRLIDEGEIKDQAEIARRTGLTRARVTQIMELRWLCPALQDQLVKRAASSFTAERAWKRAAVHREWDQQLELMG